MPTPTQTFSPQDTTSALSHFAFCALVALRFARQDGIATTPYTENLFLIRWLTMAQKQKRFSKNVATDITWLLAHGRKYGPAGKLHQHIEYLWRSCSGNLPEQSDLFRLTYATETLKNQGWESHVLDDREWRFQHFLSTPGGNRFYVEKQALNAGFTPDGHHLQPVEFYVMGDVISFAQVMSEYHLTTHLNVSKSDHQMITLFPDVDGKIKT